MNPILCAAFFLSGAAALLFETLWFRHAGLVLGNSIWASSTVLASFMAGLALGNAVAARLGTRLRRPLLLYAILETVVGVSGAGVVFLLPILGVWYKPLLTFFAENARATHVAGLALAAVLMLVPTTAMGLTLPLVTRALTAQRVAFGRALGRLYGWNTLGGVAGALGGELLLVPALGLRGTALVAMSCNLVAAVAALRLARRAEEGSDALVPSPPIDPAPGRAWPLLAATLLAGACLLSLEVVWFRFLQLFLFGSQLVFAAMLAVVLLGIGLGGLAAGRILAWRDDAWRWLPAVSVVAGLTTLFTYVAFDPRAGGRLYHGSDAATTLLFSLRLMVPTSFLSGMVFTFLGRLLRFRVGDDIATTGLATLANTLGAMAGAPLAGFVLLPWLGVDRAFFSVIIGYGAVAILSLIGGCWPGPTRLRRGSLVGVSLLYLAGVVLFPFGLMRNHFVRLSLSSYDGDGSRVVAYREGLLETISYLRTDWGGHPVSYRLITNGYSMSSTSLSAQRYMRLFVYLALALRPESRSALLISYGVGSTAKALSDARQLRSIDVVDVSPDILNLSNQLFDPPESSPLRDRRTRVHIEDGRFFLATSRDRFDLITGEPPPPLAAGIVNLYTREYFQLVHSRLTPGGMVTYWLPVHSLDLAASRAVVGAFCSVFSDCVLWNGSGRDWVLTGSRGGIPGRSEEELARQWQDPVVAPTLSRLGLDGPEQLGAIFIADAAQLAEWTAGVRALDDDHPGRLSIRHAGTEDVAEYLRLKDCRNTEPRFMRSDWVRRVWPEELRLRTSRAFPLQCAFDDQSDGRRKPDRLAQLHEVLEGSSLRTLVLLMVDSDPAIVQIARAASDAGERHPELAYHLGAAALAERRYDEAALRFGQAAKGGVIEMGSPLYRALALGLAGNRDTAQNDLETYAPAEPWLQAGRAWLLEWLRAPEARGKVASTRTAPER